MHLLSVREVAPRVRLNINDKKTNGRVLHTLTSCMDQRGGAISHTVMTIEGTLTSWQRLMYKGQFWTT